MANPVTENHSLHLGKETSEKVKLGLSAKFPSGCSIFSLEDLETIVHTISDECVAPGRTQNSNFQAGLTPPILGPQQGRRC